MIKTPTKPLDQVEFITLLALMGSIVALATDIMLPALGEIGTDLGVARVNDTQLVISSLFLGFAVGQLFVGPLSDRYGRRPVLIGGFVDDVKKIWEEHHGLLLPSRYEGAPLVVIEAMLCNRMVVATNIGRNEELIDDGKTGFIAEGPTVRLIDEALERAWNARENWQPMGELAGKQIRERYPEDPIAEFADRLLSLAQTTSNAATV